MLIACKKPCGISSFDVVKIIRTHFQDKVGHSGTLDPMASGLMILGVGKGTKELSRLIGLNKSYQTTIDFSLLTDTRDADFWEKKEEYNVTEQGLLKNGEIILKPSVKQIQELLDSILYRDGEEVFLPLPTFSAKKQNGKRLYKNARKGKAEIQEKFMKIYNYNIIDYNFPLLTVMFSVGSGTYIRSIGYRLGQQLGTGGALIDLERISIGKYSLEKIGEELCARGNIKGKNRIIFYKEIELDDVLD